MCLYAKIDFVKANPKTAQAIANAIVHAMQWLKTASVDDIIKSLPKDYYQADEKLYRKSLEKNLAAFQWTASCRRKRSAMSGRRSRSSSRS
jgi:NitT/TauT family transport system substrate-binding protein